MSCAQTVTFAFAGSPAQLSAARWQRWFVLARLAAAVVSERWAGPNVGPSVARVPRVSLSSRARSLSLSLSFSRSRRTSRRQVSTAAFRKRKQRTNTSHLRRRDTAADEKRADEKRAEKERKKKKTPGQIAAIALDHTPRSRCRLRTSNRPTPPIQERRTATTTKENHEGKVLSVRRQRERKKRPRNETGKIGRRARACATYP